MTPATGEPEEREALAALFASNAAYWELSGESGDPATILAEASRDGREALVFRDGTGRVVAFAELLLEHPRDGLPWIGLLVVDAARQGRGHGRAAAAAVAARCRARGRPGLRLAVLEANPAGLAFWMSVGFAEVDRRRDVDLDRPCVIMHREL